MAIKINNNLHSIVSTSGHFRHKDWIASTHCNVSVSDKVHTCSFITIVIITSFSGISSVQFSYRIYVSRSLIINIMTAALTRSSCE